MKNEAAQFYRCPYSGSPLDLRADITDGDDVIEGVLVNASGREYPIREGIVFFRDEAVDALNREEKQHFEWYETAGSSYDEGIDWLFAALREDEDAVRARMIALLGAADAKAIVEIGAGTCRDSLRIAARMPPGSRLFLQDFSPSILRAGREKMRAAPPFACDVEYFAGSASHLPFAAAAIDAVYHFGAFNVFPDQRGSLAEMSRVVRPNGRVVVGDESLAPWLRGTEYGSMLVDANARYADEVPLGAIPEHARDVRLEWLLGNAFYVISFNVGDGPPQLDIDLTIPGRRGGTLRTRHYGKLEGVSPELKARAEAEAARHGITVHEWLERAIVRYLQGA
jgi:ubiquinone/menaquinone biosynthesis C-methylase UbiE/uncharacterized protein YbaR (Trm112 family)